MRGIAPLVAAVLLAVCPSASRSEPHAATSGVSAAPGRPNPIDLDAQTPNLSVWQLREIIGHDVRIRLFDVRSSEEFSVSHLPGARRLDPATDRQQFVSDIGAEAHSSTIIFYCTSSGRSQLFADSVLHDLIDWGAGNVYVLAGGIMAWSNARLPLVWRDGPTELVHPHDAETAKLLDRGWLAHDAPR